MLMAERQLKILGMIQDNGSVQVEELAKKLDAKPKQFLVVPQFMPREAKGAFVSTNTAAHKAAHIEVEGTGKASYAVHRHDTKVGEIDENKGTVL